MLGVFIGGTETVPKIVAHGLVGTSAPSPDQLAAVRADLDANVPRARDEMVRSVRPRNGSRVRYASRSPSTTRRSSPGQRIIMLIASANRDEREYPNPDEFIWDRRIERSLAFGRGQHFCLGFHLARLEIATMVAEWLKRVPDYRILGEAASRPPSSFQWGWNSIPVEALTVWSYRLVAPYVFERTDIPPDKISEILPTGRCCCASSPPVSAAATFPAFRGVSGKIPGDRGARAAEMDGFPIHEIAGEVIASRHPDHRAGDRVAGWASGFDGLMELVAADGDGLAPYDPTLSAAARGLPAAAGVRPLRDGAAGRRRAPRRRHRAGIDRPAVLLRGQGRRRPPRHRRGPGRPQRRRQRVRCRHRRPRHQRPLGQPPAAR